MKLQFYGILTAESICVSLIYIYAIRTNAVVNNYNVYKNQNAQITLVKNFHLWHL